MNNLNYALILAAGTGSRAKLEKNKIFFEINNKPMIIHSIITFQESNIDEMVVVCNKNELITLSKLIESYHFNKKIFLIEGGDNRQSSSYQGLKFLKNKNCKNVLIHDAARPFVMPDLINTLLDKLTQMDAIIPAIKTVDTIATVNSNNTINNYLNRNSLISIQTPQGFNYKKLFKAYEILENALDYYTDDAGIYNKIYGEINFIEGNYKNKKMTNEFDFKEFLSDFRVGSGFDMHKLVENRPLILGGVNIPYKKGLLGHSDADSLLHAITDAILSAASLNDIGHYFPDTDPAFKDADSSILLKKALILVEDLGFKLTSLTATILAEKPKMSPFLNDIEESIATITNLDKKNIKINATTFEGLGIIGREEGIGAFANCILRK